MRKTKPLGHLFAPRGIRRTPAAPPFTPSALGGLTVWLKADALALTDGAAVTSWPDASVLGNVATAGPTPPVYYANALFGRPGVHFAGNYVKTAPFAAPLAQPLTFYAVVASDAAAGTVEVVCDGLSAASSDHMYTDGTNWIHDAGTATTMIPSGFPLAANRMALVLNVASSLLYRNGRSSGPYNPGPHGLDGLVVGAFYGLNDVFWHGFIHELLVYQGAHSPAQVAQVDGYLKAKWCGDTKAQVVCKGDSLTFGIGTSTPATQSYPAQLATALGTNWDVLDLGAVGERADTMAAAAPFEVGLYYRDTRPKNVVVVWAGVNDLLQGANDATTYGRVVALCQAVQSSGFKVVVLTIPPSNYTGTPANYETYRQSVNSSLRANWRACADALADVGGDPNYGNSANTAANTIDGLHLTQAGYAVVASYVLTGINSV